MRPLTIYTCAILITAASHLEAAGVQWRSSFLDALNESVKTKKHMVVQVTADWCTYCKKMDAVTMADPEIASLINSSFIPVKLDADAQKSLVQRIKVEYVPSTVIISGDRKILAKLPGFQSIEKLKAELNKFRPEGDSIVQGPNATATPGVVTNPIADRPQSVNNDLAANSDNRPSVQTVTNTSPFDLPQTSNTAAVNPKVANLHGPSNGSDWWNQPNPNPAKPSVSTPQVAQTQTQTQPKPTPQIEAPQTRELPPSLITRAEAKTAEVTSKPTVGEAQPSPQTQPVVKQTSGQAGATFVRPEYSFNKACLCSLLDEQTMVVGSPEFSTEYKGAKICFASADHLQRFESNPKRYWPAWGGVCAVSLRDGGKLVEGSPSYGAVYQDRLWFFTSQQQKALFTSDPGGFLPRR